MPLPAISTDAPDLTFIVPVHDAESHLEGLVDRIAALAGDGLRCQMIFVDDASSDGSVALLEQLATTHDDLTVIRQPENRGAGLARNEGWKQATGRYTIFFDADDVLHDRVIAEAIRDLDAEPEVDVAIFAYRYEREATASFTDMGYSDKKILETLLKGNSTASGALDEMAKLLAFTNYPWNKILRTSRYRKAGMRFGATKVNNDILGHWHALLLARRIMVRDATICTHIVHPTGANITNLFGAERLQMFDALGETYEFLAAYPDLRRRVAHHYWELANRLFRWARPRLDPEFRVAFDGRVADLVSRLDISDLARMRTGRHPELASMLSRQLTR